MPRRSSNSATLWLTVDLGAPSAWAAARKLFSSTTLAKVNTGPRSAIFIVLLVGQYIQIIEIERIHPWPQENGHAQEHEKIRRGGLDRRACPDGVWAVGARAPGHRRPGWCHDGAADSERHGAGALPR